jgi:hypothetical protein
MSTGRKAVVGLGIGLAGFVAFGLARDVSFSDGWEAARCDDWKAMKESPQSFGFDPANISNAERASFNHSCDV